MCAKIHFKRKFNIHIFNISKNMYFTLKSNFLLKYSIDLWCNQEYQTVQLWKFYYPEHKELCYGMKSNNSLHNEYNNNNVQTFITQNKY